VAFVMGREVNMLRKTERGEKLGGEVICEIIETNVNVASDDKFSRCGGCKGEKRIEILIENGVQLRMGGR